MYVQPLRILAFFSTKRFRFLIILATIIATNDFLSLGDTLCSEPKYNSLLPWSRRVFTISDCFLPFQKKKKQPSYWKMMEIVTKALFDCLSEEIVLLNEDIKDDAIISSIFNDAELREDIDGNYIVLAEGDQHDDGDSDHLLKQKGAQHGNSPIAKQTVKQKRNDDERSGLLAMNGRRIQHDIPISIEFKPKKKRQDRFRDETQSQNKSSTKLNSGYFFTSSIQQSEAEEVPTNKNKLSRWMGKGKKGVHTSRAEF